MRRRRAQMSGVQMSGVQMSQARTSLGRQGRVGQNGRSRLQIGARSPAAPRRGGHSPTHQARASAPNDKCIACERTNIAQLVRGCAMDFSWHADHMDMRLARRDARIDKCDRHT